MPKQARPGWAPNTAFDRAAHRIEGDPGALAAGQLADARDHVVLLGGDDLSGARLE